MRLRSSVLLLVALALVAGATAASAAAFAQDTPPDNGLGIRLLEVPEARRDDPRAQSYIIDHVVPGTTFSRRIEVSNGTDRALPTTLYAGPASVVDGSFTFGEPGAESELTRWVRLAPTSVEIPAGGRIEAKVSVAVPAAATAGERYGVVWAETPGEKPEGGGVAVNSRVGIRIYLSVGPGGEPATDFSLDTFQPVITDQGRPAVVIETCNRGERAIDVAGSVALADGPGGTSAGPFETAGPRTFAPAECGEVTVAMADGLPRGPWQATARLRSGELERVATAPITFPAGPGRGERVATESPLDSAGGRTVLGLAVLALVAVISALAIVNWRRRRLGATGPA